MRRPKNQITGGADLVVGIGLHENRQHVTIRTFDLELSAPAVQRLGSIVPGLESICWLT